MSNNKNLSALAAVLDDGTSGQVLTSDGGGAVSFQAASGGIALSDLSVGSVHNNRGLMNE